MCLKLFQRLRVSATGLPTGTPTQRSATGLILQPGSILKPIGSALPACCGRVERARPEAPSRSFRRESPSCESRLRASARLGQPCSANPARAGRPEPGRLTDWSHAVRNLSGPSSANTTQRHSTASPQLPCRRAPAVALRVRGGVRPVVGARSCWFRRVAVWPGHEPEPASRLDIVPVSWRWGIVRGRDRRAGEHVLSGCACHPCTIEWQQTSQDE